ncbi:plasmid replication protein RepC [Salipiger abyssi]|uniref:plasmid replication protein RepC n=1 Tax=Salipiger abyssi TaxID=1250539 RepID=UPI000975EA89|nr:plasmid replication protein RepC [Salipiger abyssi]
MKQITSAAPRAGAQKACVQTPIAGFRPILRRELLYALRTARVSLGLSGRDVQVLDTLLSFLPCRDRQTGGERPVGPDMMLVVYAANSTICERANGMCDRSLRRYIDRLVTAGLIARRDSATGKRFPLRRGGRIVDAYGLDLTPLFHSAERILELARQAEQDKEEIRSLRAQALTLRATLLDAADTLSETDLTFVLSAKTILRRVSLGLAGTRDILDKLQALIRSSSSPATQDATVPGPDTTVCAPAPAHENPRRTSANTTKEPGGNGQTVRQVEPKKINTKKPRSDQSHDLTGRWSQYPTLASFFPSSPQTANDLNETLPILARLVGLAEKSLISALRAIGLNQTLHALEYIAMHADHIQRPEDYFAKLVEKAMASTSARRCFTGKQGQAYSRQL